MRLDSYSFYLFLKSAVCLLFLVVIDFISVEFFSLLIQRKSFRGALRQGISVKISRNTQIVMSYLWKAAAGFLPGIATLGAVLGTAP